MEENNINENKKNETQKETNNVEFHEVKETVQEEGKLKEDIQEARENTKEVKEEAKQKTEKNIKKDKKPVSLKKIIIGRIIFLTIFLVIVIGTTIYFILNSPTKEEKDEGKNSLVEEKNEVKEHIEEKTINLNDTFNSNALKIDEIKENYRNYEIPYFQIDGLKDKSIQEKINNNLKKDIEEAVDKAIDEKKINKANFYVSGTIDSSFANTLSIYYNLYSYIEKENYTYENLLNEFVTENFDLTTGNRITIDDIFTKNVKGAEILTDSSYDSLIRRFATIEMNEETGDEIITNYNIDVEETMLEIITRINNRDKTLKLSFDEQKVNLLEYGISIYYKNMLDKTVIYDKFKTDINIFDDQYTRNTNIPVLVKRFNYYTLSEIVEKGDNYYIDFTLLKYTEKDKLTDDVKYAAENKLSQYANEIKERAQKSNKFIVANYSFQIDEIYNSDAPEGLELNKDFQLDIIKYELETTKSKFDSEIYPRIIDTFRYYPEFETGEPYLYENIFFNYINMTYKNGKYEEYDYRIDCDSSHEVVYIKSDGTIVEDNEENIGSNIEENNSEYKPWETID